MSTGPFETSASSLDNDARKTADQSWDSPFHTLGKGATQAAPGNHKHSAGDISGLPEGVGLSNSDPIVDGIANPGVGTQASRHDHRHPNSPGIGLGNDIPPADSGGGAVGVGTTAARADHRHPMHNVGYADNAGNANTLEGLGQGAFARASHGSHAVYAGGSSVVTTASNGEVWIVAWGSGAPQGGIPLVSNGDWHAHSRAPHIGAWNGASFRIDNLDPNKAFRANWIVL